MTTFFDANLLRDIVAKKSVTAVLYFVNTTPTDWFSMTPSTVETATYGSELILPKFQQIKLWTSKTHLGT